MHTNPNRQGQAVPPDRNKKRRQLTGWLLAAAVIVLCSKPTQASVLEFTGGPTTTQTDAEVYFSPLSGQVGTSYSGNALFGIANVAGNLAIAFNTTPDGTLVVAPNRLNPSLSTVARLSSGAMVGAGSQFDNTEYTVAESDGLIGNWNQLGSGFFGWRFGTGTDVHYGWASITVLPDYNITLNSFAYETVAGQPITIATTPVPEPSSFAFVGIVGVLGILFGIRRRFSRRVQGVSMAAGLVAVATVLSAQTPTLPGQTDPVGNHLMQFRSDHLFNIRDNSPDTIFDTFGVQYSDNPFSTSLSDSSYSVTSVVAGRQYHAVSGHFLQPDQENVVIAYANGSNIDVQVVGQSAANISLPTPVLPRYSTSAPNGLTYSTVDFIATAAADLDHAVDSSGNYHDEVVIAYVTAQNTYDVVVLDFSANVVDPDTGNLTVGPPKIVEFQALEGLQFNPAMMFSGNPSQSSTGHVLAFDNILSVSTGDFDGDGVAEIAIDAINYQPAQDNSPDTTLSVQTLRYRSELPSVFEVGLQSLTPPQIQVQNSQQPAYLGANLTMTSGDYEGRGGDDVALGYLAYGPPLQINNTQPVAPTFVIHLLNASTQAVSIQAQLVNGNPTQLVVDSSLAGRIPQQLTISNAPDSWAILNGTWQTTLSSSGGQLQISIPVDTSALQSGSGQITVLLSTALEPAIGATPLQVTTNSFYPTMLGDYPKLQLVSGLFKFDPPNGWGFSRRQFAAIWNIPEGCSTESCYSSNSQFINVSSYSVSQNQGNLQFNSEGNYSFAGEDGTQPAQRIAATAGAFRGDTVLNSDGSQNRSPVWSLALNIMLSNSQDLIVILEPNGSSFSAAGQAYSTSQESSTPSVDTEKRLAVVNYDADGSSLYLGAPIRLTASNLFTPTTILQEPPKHLAWLNGSILNLNRNDGFNVQLTDTLGEQATTSTQQQSSSDFSAVNSISAGLSVKTTIFPGISNSLSTKDTAKFSYDKSHTNSNYYSQNGSLTYSSGAETDHDDFIQALNQNLNIWRYRVYSASSNASSGYTFYDLTYPSSPYNASGPGTSIDWYNPVHENGNVLSYPPWSSSQVPDDVGPAYQVNGQTPPGLSNGVLYSGQGFCFGGVRGAQTINMTGVTSFGDTVETSKSFSWDNDTQVADTFKVGGVKASASYDGDFGQKQSLSKSTASDNTTTGSKSVTFNVDDGEGTNGYNIFPVFYNSNAGVLKFVHYVSIPTSGSTGECVAGGKWWTDNYGGAPDPALNLPFRFVFGSYSTSSDTTTWSLQTDLQREQMRGFFLTSATANTVESTQDNPVYTPLASNPVEGSQVRMAVRVYNFSLNQPASGVTAQFSVVPYDTGTDNELACGTPASAETGRHCAPNVRTVLGSVNLPTIPSWGAGTNWTTAEYLWTIPQGFIAQQNSPEFRIYVNLTYAGTELNPPQAPCNNSPASNPVPCLPNIADSASDTNANTYWDPNAPGQNNEGWSLITLQAASGPSAAAVSALMRHSLQATSALLAANDVPPQTGSSASNIKTTDDSLAAVDPAGLLKSGLVVAYQGRPLRVRVKAVSEGSEIQEQQKALVFDGAGPGQKLIAAKALKGVKAEGTSAWFHWTPTTRGLHQLTAEVLEPQEDLVKGDNVAKLSVIVVRAPGDVNGDGSVDALDTAMISEQIGKSTAASTCGAACDLNGDGYIGRADLELAMAHCDHTSCAVSHTIAPKRKKKQSR